MKADSATALSLLATYGTIVSVIAVYHLFALQAWVQRCDQAVDNADMVLESTPATSIQRVHAASRCRSAARSLPLLQVSVILCAVSAVCMLTVAVAHNIQNVALLYTAGPVLGLALLLVVATVAAIARCEIQLRRRGQRLLGEADLL